MDGKHIHFTSRTSRQPPAMINPMSNPMAIKCVVSGVHFPDEFIEYPGTHSLQVFWSPEHTAHMISAHGLQLEVLSSKLYPRTQRKQEYFSTHNSHPVPHTSQKVPFEVVLGKY